jgi:hypothetical protein
LARAAYTAAVYPAGPDPRINTFVCFAVDMSGSFGRVLYVLCVQLVAFPTKSIADNGARDEGVDCAFDRKTPS